MLTRRWFVTGLIAAPLVVRADSLMALRGVPLWAVEWNGQGFDTLQAAVDHVTAAYARNRKLLEAADEVFAIHSGAHFVRYGDYGNRTLYAPEMSLRKTERLHLTFPMRFSLVTASK